MKFSCHSSSIFFSASLTFEGYNYTRPCQPSPCDHTNVCTDYTSSVAMCGSCTSPENLSNSFCKSQCLCNADFPFSQACIGWKCADPWFLWRKCSLSSCVTYSSLQLSPRTLRRSIPRLLSSAREAGIRPMQFSSMWSQCQMRRTKQSDGLPM